MVRRVTFSTQPGNACSGLDQGLSRLTLAKNGIREQLIINFYGFNIYIVIFFIFRISNVLLWIMSRLRD